MGKIKAILFDMDGVLLDSDRYESENERYILETHAKHKCISIAEAREKWLEFSESHWGTRQWHDWRLACSYLGSEKIWVEAHLQNLKYLKLRPGAKKLIEKLAAKYKLALTSDGIKEVIDIKLGYFGLLHYFDNIFSQDTFGASKKEEKYFQGVLKTLCLKNNEVVLIEDRERSIRTASKLGIKTILIPYVYKVHAHIKKLLKQEKIVGYTYKAKKLSEIPLILEKIENSEN